MSSPFAAWFPGGATLSPPYLRRSLATRYYVRSDSSPPPDSRSLRSTTLQRPRSRSGLPSRCRLFFAGRLPPQPLFMPESRQPATLEREEEVSPVHAWRSATAPPRKTPDSSRAHTPFRMLRLGASARTADWPVIRCLINGFAFLQLSCLLPTLPDAALQRRPVFSYPALERSTGTGLSPASAMPLRAAPCGGPLVRRLQNQLLHPASRQAHDSNHGARAADRWSGGYRPNCSARRAVGRTIPTVALVQRTTDPATSERTCPARRAAGRKKLSHEPFMRGEFFCRNCYRLQPSR